jgi:release factor glutamine methyltransferase
MNRVIRTIAERFYRPVLVRYLSATRMYGYRGIRLEVPPGVFHPGFFFSSKFLLRFLARQQLKGRSFLELGAGSGLISLFAARQGAVVTATDINPTAIACMERNNSLNSASLEIIQSDLYALIPMQPFDVVAVNPPYYRKDPASDAERAWYCGANGEYFDEFFRGLVHYVHSRSNIWMVLCEGCDLVMINRLAACHGWELDCVETRHNLIERDYIFQISPLTGSGGIL